MKEHAAKLSGQLAQLTSMVGSHWAAGRRVGCPGHSLDLCTGSTLRPLDQVVWQMTLACTRSAPRQVRGELSGEARRKVNTLIITDVHGRDIVDGFVRDSVADAADFAWESQLRFYWERGQAREWLAGAV